MGDRSKPDTDQKQKSHEYYPQTICRLKEDIDLRVTDFTPIQNVSRSLQFRYVEDESAAKGKGPWSPISYEGAAPLQVSLCYDSLGSRVENVRAHTKFSKGNMLVNEPSASVNLSSLRFDTLAVRRQLGVTSERLTTRERGVWELDTKKHRQDANSEENRNSTQIIHGFDEYRPVEKGVIICTGCIDRDFYVVEIQALEDTQSAIYVDTLMDTENPALALQALNTNMMRMLHAEYLPQFDYNDRQTAVFYETTILPIKTRGFIIVITLIWLRLIATFWITVAFLTKTRYSRLNNAWQVLSHLRTLKMDDFLDESLTDKEIKERLQAQGTAHQLVRLEPNGDVGDIGLWRRSEKKAARDTKEEEPIESEQGEAA